MIGTRQRVVLRLACAVWKLRKNANSRVASRAPAQRLVASGGSKASGRLPPAHRKGQYTAASSSQQTRYFTLQISGVKVKSCAWDRTNIDGLPSFTATPKLLTSRSSSPDRMLCNESRPSCCNKGCACRKRGSWLWVTAGCYPGVDLE